MNEMEILFERESDAPEGWQDNVIFERDGKGNFVEVLVPDDEEVDADVAND